MTALQFKKATKAQAKLRAALFGPSGSGKTFSALRIATGMGGSIALIDTERGSASKYADRFEFDTLDLATPTIDAYIAAIGAAGQAGYAVLIIDSLSHGWHELLQEVEKLAQAKYRGNTWSAWSEGTPRQRKLIDALLDFPGHIIATIRSKTAWEINQNERGKSAPVRVGLAPDQGKGIEYEFDLLLELSVDHTANVIKDRTGKFQDQLIDKPGEDFGAVLMEWLGSGVDPLADDEHARQAISKAMDAMGHSRDQKKAEFDKWLERIGKDSLSDTTVEERKAFIAAFDPQPPEPEQQTLDATPEPQNA